MDTPAELQPADEPVPTVPAATVVVARDVDPAAVDPATGDPGIEVLMLRRNAALSFAGGMWVFPGGRVDPEDRVGLPDPSDDAAAARHTAVREAEEEAGITLAADDLTWFAHWTPPVVRLKRFATWFFVCEAPVDLADITIDGGEIHDHAWMRPADALARCNAGDIDLSPPTWISLEYLQLFPTASALCAHAAEHPPQWFATRIAASGDAIVALYDGDAGYADTDPDAEGGRHRLWMAPGQWRYERDDWPPPL